MPSTGPTRKYFKLDPKLTPALNALISQIEQPNYSGTTQQFFALEKTFSDFVNADELKSIVDFEIAVMRETPGYIPAGSHGNTILIFDSPKVALTAIVFDKNNTSTDKIFSAAGDALFGNVGPNEMPLQLHEISGTCNLDVLDVKERITPLKSVNLSVGGVLKIPSENIVAEYKASKQTAVLKLTSKLYHPLIWVYDKLTGVPRFCSSGDLHASRLQATIGLLDALEARSSVHSNDSINSLELLAGHRFHFVRWAAIRSLCKMDFATGKQLLLNAEQDPHPHISQAAKSSVEKLRVQGLVI